MMSAKSASRSQSQNTLELACKSRLAAATRPARGGIGLRPRD